MQADESVDFTDKCHVLVRFVNDPGNQDFPDANSFYTETDKWPSYS